MIERTLKDCIGPACNEWAKGVYLIKGDSGWRKIGFSNDVFDRCYGTRPSALQNGLLWPIFPLYNYRSVAFRGIEWRLHKKFEKNKKCPPNYFASGTSEWFYFDDPSYIDNNFIEECIAAEIDDLKNSCFDLKNKTVVRHISFEHEYAPDWYVVDMVNKVDDIEMRKTFDVFADIKIGK